MLLVLDEHRQYLSDAPRIRAFRKALREVVKPGACVLDLGAGTGILGLLAFQSGAGRVYFIDSGGMVELARQICRANGFGDRAVFIRGLSTRVTLPEKVDVVVSDQIGWMGFDAGVVEVFADARERFLEPGGMLVPSRVALCAAPVESSEAWANVEFWDKPRAGLDLRPGRPIAVNTSYPVKLERGNLLARPEPFARIDLTQPVPGSVASDVSFAIERRGVLHGLGAWFVATLSESATMTNSPLARAPINRRNAFLPIGRPVQVRPGDRVRLRCHILTADPLISWKVTVLKSPQARNGRSRTTAEFTHSTMAGMLIGRDALARTHPDSEPCLTPWGHARLTVLKLCNGRRPLREVERLVYRRHQALFRSAADAAGFVAEVVTRYTS